MTTVKDPYKFITEHLNNNQSKLRSLLRQMNDKQNRGRGSQMTKRRVTMSPYEKVMLRQFNPQPPRLSPMNSAGSRSNTPSKAPFDQNKLPLSAYR